MTARQLVLLHGFLRTGASMAFLGARLKPLGYSAIHLPTFGYHLRTIEAHGAELRRRLSALEGEYDVVTFSFGGVLLRAALADATEGPRRVVMLAPPSEGALLAEQIRSHLPVHQLGWDPLAPLLPGAPARFPMPMAEVGILAGGTGRDTGFNRWLPGDNDGKVRVSEAMQPGAAFKVIPQRHFQMPFSDLALQETRAFLETGAFLDAPAHSTKPSPPAQEPRE